MHRYFAYGSNLHPRRLGARVAIAADLGTALLPGWALKLHKRGVDGSGKGDVVATGAADDAVYGAVYLLDDAARAQLDVIEGIGFGYRAQVLTLPALGEVFCYVAEAGAIDPTLRPYDWYLELICAGARRRAFPAPYLAFLTAHLARPDPDPARAAAARRLLED
jgi:hypothetical protein